LNEQNKKDIEPFILAKLGSDHFYSLLDKRYDVKVSEHDVQTGSGVQRAIITYCEGLTDAKEINDFILSHLQRILLHSELTSDGLSSDIEMQLNIYNRDTSIDEIMSAIFEGELLIWFPAYELAYSVDIAKAPQRQVEESTSEVSVKGARDGFTEDIIVNVALIRKRLRSLTLANERFVIGSRSHTKVSLLYLEDVTNAGWVEQSRQRLQAIETEILANAQQLEEYVTGRAYNLFPLVDYIGRPDFVIQALERGKLIFLVDGSPIALIAPASFQSLIKSPEDAYFPPYFVAFERFIRMVGLFTSILLPGFWVALSSFNLDQLPFTLLTTVTVSRTGLPLPAPLEAFLMIGLFEVFREAGVRLPKAVGQTVAVVGGLIIGETAVNAGLTSPTMLVVTSISAVSSFLLVNQTLSGTISLVRLYVLLCSSFLGIFGLFASFFSIILYLSRLRMFDVPYLAPSSPLRFRDMLANWGFIPQSDEKKREDTLKTSK
jgi:hypothetical protein